MSRTYPPAPWNLQGSGVQIVHTVDIRSVRELVPSELSIVQLWPGRTLGVVAFAHYGPGSVLEYDELIIAPALVRYEGKLGMWVSHIYVDDPVSLQGGREIWGVPKELATIEWNDDGRVGRVAAYSHGRKLCSVNVRRRWWLLRKRMRFPTYSRLGGDLIRFTGEATGRIGWGRGELDIPPDAPFASIRTSRPKLSLWLDNMVLVCGKPETVGASTVIPVEPAAFQPALGCSEFDRELMRRLEAMRTGKDPGVSAQETFAKLRSRLPSH